jgi:hypothetical protein
MNRFQALWPYADPEAVLGIFRREFERAHRDGGLFLLTMHPHVIAYRSRLFILEDLIERMRGVDALFATHADIAAWCKSGGTER